jgi:hypothetical protein
MLPNEERQLDNWSATASFCAFVGAVAVVLLVLLYLTGNIHCWNVPIIGKGCNIG